MGAASDMPHSRFDAASQVQHLTLGPPVTEDVYKPYVHVPAHLFRAGGVYSVTVGTYRKRHYLHDAERKRQWLDSLQFVLQREQWQLTAWVVLDNHYHLIIHAPERGADGLSGMFRDMHRFLATTWNKADEAPGRVIWYNYWDTCVDCEGSYYARVNYVHWNPVKHGIVADPRAYPFSSYRAYLAAQKEDVRRWEHEYPWGKLKIEDDF
jgi:putative transposase